MMTRGTALVPARQWTCARSSRICEDDCGKCGSDDCDGAAPIGDGLTAYSTLGATTDGNVHPDCEFDGQTYNDIWFDYIASCTGTLVVTTCEDNGGSADYDTDLVIYDGLGCIPTDADLLACSDDDCSPAGLYHSFLQIEVSAGNAYKIRVGGWNDGDQGTGNLLVDCGG